MGERSWKPKSGDVIIAVSVGICLLLRDVFHFQAVTAAITTLLVGQTSSGVEFKTGFQRVLGTGLGGIIGVLAAVLDVWFHISWLFILLVMAGMLLTIVSCRLLRMPEFTDRVAGITFILVAMSIPGVERISYAVYRLLSTLGGVLIWLGVACIVLQWKHLRQRSKRPATKEN